MTVCEKYAEQISCYIDGELTDTERAELEAHLENCPSCRALLEIYRNIDDAQETLPVPEGFSAAVMKKISRVPLQPATPEEKTPAAKKSAGRKRLVSRLALIAACLVLVVYGAFTMDFGFGATEGGEAAPEAVNAPGGYTEASGTAERDLEFPTADSADTAAPEELPPPESEGGVENTNPYYTTLYISGTLPAQLEGFSQSDNGDGSYSILIPAALAETLAQENTTIPVENPQAEEALVIFTPTDTPEEIPPEAENTQPETPEEETVPSSTAAN